MYYDTLLDFFRNRLKKKFWKRYIILAILTPIVLYWRDNKQTKQNAQKNASRLSSTSSSEIRKLISLCQMTNKDLMDFYIWLVREYGKNDVDFRMTIDDFGEAFARAASIFDERKKETESNEDKIIEEKLEKIKIEEENKKSDKQKLKEQEMKKDRELISKSDKLEPWDINCLFREMKIYQSTKIPLNLLCVGISPITMDDTSSKCEFGFRVCSQMLHDENPVLSFTDFVALLDDMIITGHFSTDSLITRKSWLPSAFNILTAHNIASSIYKIVGIDETQNITLMQFQNALSN